MAFLILRSEFRSYRYLFLESALHARISTSYSWLFEDPKKAKVPLLTRLYININSRGFMDVLQTGVKKC